MSEFKIKVKCFYCGNKHTYRFKSLEEVGTYMCENCYATRPVKDDALALWQVEDNIIYADFKSK